MYYAIVYEDRNGNEGKQIGKSFTSKKKADAEAQRLNEAVRVRGNGKYIVIVL